VFALQLQWYGKSCTIAKDNILHKGNILLNYDNISVITACHINFDSVDSYKRLIKKEKSYQYTCSCFVIEVVSSVYHLLHMIR
jgi:hypothetical protein